MIGETYYYYYLWWICNNKKVKVSESMFGFFVVLLGWFREKILDFSVFSTICIKLLHHLVGHWTMLDTGCWVFIWDLRIIIDKCHNLSFICIMYIAIISQKLM
jgi:hypothetical protein